ncbi:hypothetical protein [uncultured Hydrogenophaga sp.]|uniref:hypothetical protein n=1 Tax=uncultured Hydrogenophaga sp. TaxID=199683 RepID=UPI00265F746E|nr:hypothetical protein [uncultured Hydrogenophaga sp.]
MSSRLACLAMLCSVAQLPALAQDRIYRCGNEYTNNAQVAKSRGCTVIDGGNITVIEGPKPATPAPSRPAASQGSGTSERSSGERIDSASQRARDSDARAILESELRRAEARLNEARTAYANGAPEKQGIEGRNHQRYLDRVAELKAALTRAENDVAGLQRELARLGGQPSGR